MNTDKQQTNKSLKYSFFNGIFASAMTGFVNEYLTPFILLLGGTTRQVGALNAFPNIFAALAQMKSANIVERLKSRKKMVGIFVFFQALILLAITIITFLRRMRPDTLIVFIILLTCCGAVVNGAWGSLMSDLVEKSKRGQYFGWRTKVLGLVTVGSVFLAGFILHLMKKVNIFYGFTILFGGAFLWRMISWFFLRKMHEPYLSYRKEANFTLFQFLSRLKESNFAKFVLFAALMNFSVNIASPYFSVLMLKDLKFSYFLYTLIIIPSTLTMNLSMARWGRLADRIGNLKIIKFTASLIGIIPILWIINRHSVFLVGAQVFSGFVWAGFHLCTSNFIYDAVSPEKRTRCIAYFNVLNGLALSFGALLGGFLLPWLPSLFGYKILTLFLISTVLRIIVGIYLPLKLKEVRPVEKMRSHQVFFSMLSIKPLLGIERETIRYRQI